MVSVEITYAKTDKIIITFELNLPEGATVAEAIQLSKLYDQHPEARGLPLGIFSKQCELNTRLKPGDRIEIYRPLLLDPKERRRQRAKAQLTQSKK